MYLIKKGVNFRRFHKISKSDYHLFISDRLSALKYSAPSGRVFIKFDIYGFSKIRRDISTFIKILPE
jgi:hypothetical protein